VEQWCWQEERREGKSSKEVMLMEISDMQIAEYVLLSVIIALGALAYFNIIG
jgi:hypothetical protein